MSKFEFPKLSRNDIVTILADSQIIAISDRDLVNPNPDFVADLFARILSHIDFLHEYVPLLKNLILPFFPLRKFAHFTGKQSPNFSPFYVFSLFWVLISSNFYFIFKRDGLGPRCSVWFLKEKKKGKRERWIEVKKNPCLGF